ncbi:hypothetical protein L596_020148 [Steinernema carpocapsae]|uniref:Uncharacterized protein n=1 Tax=Steinernema carpocapsae TaxID=34508 RepID=A0A4U5MTC0_STECR|nr:hypothetical protein L596_020148 [Steinernema carpocapsae]
MFGPQTCLLLSSPRSFYSRPSDSISTSSLSGPSVPALENRLSPLRSVHDESQTIQTQPPDLPTNPQIAAQSNLN